MAFKSLVSRWLFVVPIAISALAVQEATKLPSSEDPGTDTEIALAIRTALSEELTPSALDRIAVLAMRRSAVAVPLIVGKLTSGSTAKADNRKLADVLAYVSGAATGEMAADALLQLAESDEGRYGYLVSRSLDYSWGRANPFALAYRVVSRGHAASRAKLAEWLSINLGNRGAYRAWAAAVADRNEGQTVENALATDALVQILSGEVPEALRSETRAVLARRAALNEKR